jgi:hypothetical protein
MNLLQRVDGRKTYIIAGLTVAYGIIGLIIGQLEATEGIQVVLAGLAAFGFRSALNK